MHSQEAEHRFGYRETLGPDQQAIYENNRELFKAMFDYVQSVGDPSRERSLAMTALQESLLWLNCHVASNGVTK